MAVLPSDNNKKTGNQNGGDNYMRFLFSRKRREDLQEIQQPKKKRRLTHKTKDVPRKTFMRKRRIKNLSESELKKIQEMFYAPVKRCCQWPFGDPQTPEFHFCGKAVNNGPYCNWHKRLAYVDKKVLQSNL